VHMYVMAIFSLSFIFILGYLFVPLLLFKFTGDYFRKWLNICFGYMLMPVILMAYMAMMLVALDVTLFTGPFALWRQVSPAGFDANNNPFSAAVNQTYQALNVNKDDPTINKPVTPFYVDMMETFQIGGNPVDAGTLGQLTQDPNYTGTAYRANAAANANNGTGGVMPASVPRTVLNLTGMAGAMPDHSVENYVVRILTSFCVAALLAYIMYSMLSYIPNLASDLVSQGSRGSMGAVAKTEVFAEALVRGTIEATKEIAIAAALAMATGGTSLAASGGKVAAEQTAKQMLKKSAVRIAKQQAQQAAQRRAAASKSSDGTS